MNYEISVYFRSTDIKEYIRESRLIIGNKSFNINKSGYKITNYVFSTHLNNPKKIKNLNIIINFFIDNKCVYNCSDSEYSYSSNDLLVYDIDKDLFYKCFYWLINSDIFDHDKGALVYILALAQDKKFIRIAKKLISEKKSDTIGIPFGKDLSILKFICKICKKKYVTKRT